MRDIWINFKDGRYLFRADHWPEWGGVQVRVSAHTFFRLRNSFPQHKDQAFLKRAYQAGWNIESIYQWGRGRDKKIDQETLERLLDEQEQGWAEHQRIWTGIVTSGQYERTKSVPRVSVMRPLFNL